jgi:hypothetical protein
MGNSASIEPIKSFECPICFEETFEPIKLNCGHKFDKYCIQKYIYNEIINEYEIKCPYCRNNLNINDLELILKEWMFVNFIPNNWKQINTIELNKNDKIKYFTKLDFIYNISFIEKIIIPQLSNNLPFFITSPEINDISEFFEDDVIVLSEFFKNKKIKYSQDILPYYSCGINCYMNYKNEWFYFLKKNLNKIKNIIDYNIDFNEQYKYSKYKLKLYIKDPNDIIIINQLEGTMNKGIIIHKGQRCKCLFKMYFYTDHNNTFLINELFTINYY